MKLTETLYESAVDMHENQQMMLQQETIQFNQQVDEDLTPEEYKEVMCSNPDEIELPPNLGNVEKQKAEEFRMACGKATLPQLKAAKQQIKQLKRQQQNEQIAAPALVTILGVSMNPGVAIAVGVVLFALVLSFIGKLFRNKRTTYFCDGTRSRGLFGLLRW